MGGLLGEGDMGWIKDMVGYGLQIVSLHAQGVFTGTLSASAGRDHPSPAAKTLQDVGSP